MSTAELLMTKKLVNELHTAANATLTLRECVQQALERYLSQLEGYPAAHIHQMVMAEVEIPLFQTILYYAKGNQSKAAKILGISRGTLRKKLKEYHLE